VHKAIDSWPWVWELVGLREISASRLSSSDESVMSAGFTADPLF